jgi:hypothetical protein
MVSFRRQNEGIVKTIKNLFLIAIVLFAGWLIVINGLKQFPRDSELRKNADPVVNWIFELFGGKVVEHFNSPEQERNLKACFDAFSAKTQEPEQCAPMIACLKKTGDVLTGRGVAYKSYSIHRLSKVSLGWQMDLLYTSVEAGDGSQKILEHVICIADGDRVINIKRPNEN